MSNPGYPDGNRFWHLGMAHKGEGMNAHSNQGFALPLFILCVCGLLGILVDLDHLAIPTQQILTLLSGGIPSYAGRPAHIPCVVVSGLVWFVANALVLRLLCKYMAMKRK